MKKIFLIFLIIVFSNSNIYAEKVETKEVLQHINVSCEGELKQTRNYYADGSTRIQVENFYEDFEFVINKKNKLIAYIKLIDTSHLFHREGTYVTVSSLAKNDGFGKLRVNDNQNIFSFNSADWKKISDGTWKKMERKHTYSRLSGVTGTYSGEWIIYMYKQKNSQTPGLSFKYDFVTNCYGLDNLFAALDNKQPNQEYLDIGDNEIVPVSSGTGFLVSKNGLMITNHHVIEGCNNVKAIYKGEEFDTQTQSIDKINDLAIIVSNIISPKVFSLSDQDGKLLEEVIVAGYPLGKKISSSIKATSGTITSLSGLGDNYAEFQTDAALNSGNSGGPIINKKGNVVGVAVSKIQSEGVESFNFGIKSSILKIFANSNEVQFNPPNIEIMKKKDLGSLITEATVYLECWMSGKQLKAMLSQENDTKKAVYIELIK